MSSSTYTNPLLQKLAAVARYLGHYSSSGWRIHHHIRALASLASQHNL